MERVINLLKRTDSMTLATSSSDKPRASVLEHHIVGNETIVFCTGRHSIKGMNLAQNRQVSISVLNVPEMATIDGIVTEPSNEEIAAFNQKLLAKHPDFEPMLASGEMCYYKVVIDAAYYVDMRKGALDAEIIKA
jgi:uncharacterized pyridoxamine 5'-phosphate oxidase family protein